MNASGENSAIESKHAKDLNYWLTLNGSDISAFKPQPEQRINPKRLNDSTTQQKS
jgi:hypothetical protein